MKLENRLLLNVAVGTSGEGRRRCCHIHGGIAKRPQFKSAMPVFILRRRNASMQVCGTRVVGLGTCILVDGRRGAVTIKTDMAQADITQIVLPWQREFEPAGLRIESHRTGFDVAREEIGTITMDPESSGRQLKAGAQASTYM